MSAVVLAGIRFDRCLCRNAKDAQAPECDRCAELRARRAVAQDQHRRRPVPDTHRRPSRWDWSIVPVSKLSAAEASVRQAVRTSDRSELVPSLAGRLRPPLEIQAVEFALGRLVSVALKERQDLAGRNLKSLDAPLGDEDGLTLHDLLPSAPLNPAVRRDLVHLANQEHWVSRLRQVGVPAFLAEAGVPQRSRAALTLRFDGHSHAEIAVMTGVSRNAVKQRVRRGLRALAYKTYPPAA